jgi:hypothetical protein
MQACLQRAVVTAHALRQAASEHAASHAEQVVVQGALHATQVDWQSCWQSSVSDPHRLGTHACSNAGAHVKTSSS